MELDEILNIDIDPDLLLSLELEKLNLDDIPNDISDLLEEIPEKDGSAAAQNNAEESERASKAGYSDYFQTCGSKSDTVLDESGRNTSEVKINAMRKECENDKGSSKRIEGGGDLRPSTYWETKNCGRTQSNFKRKISRSDSSHVRFNLTATIQKRVPSVFGGIHYPNTSSTLDYYEYPKFRKAGSPASEYHSSLRWMVESSPYPPLCSPLNLEPIPESINEQDVWKFLIENGESDSTNSSSDASGVGSKDDQGRIAEIMNFLKGMPDEESSKLIERVRRLKCLKPLICRRTGDYGRPLFDFKRMRLWSGSGLVQSNRSSTPNTVVQNTVPCNTEFSNDSSHQDFNEDVRAGLVGGRESAHSSCAPSAIRSSLPVSVLPSANLYFTPETVFEQDILDIGNMDSASTSNGGSVFRIHDLDKTTEVIDFLKSRTDKSNSKPIGRGGHLSRSICKRTENYKRTQFHFNRKRSWSGSCQARLNKSTTPDVTILSPCVSPASKFAHISSTQDIYEDAMSQSVSSPESGYDSSTPSIIGSPSHLPVSSPLNLDFIPETVDEQVSMDTLIENAGGT